MARRNISTAAGLQFLVWGGVAYGIYKLVKGIESLVPDKTKGTIKKGASSADKWVKDKMYWLMYGDGRPILHALVPISSIVVPGKPSVSLNKEEFNRTIVSFVNKFSATGYISKSDAQTAIEYYGREKISDDEDKVVTPSNLGKLAGLIQDIKAEKIELLEDYTDKKPRPKI